MKISEFQQLIENIYLDRDSQRGVDRNFVWFTEEVGELAREIRHQPRNKERLFEEFANVFAWLSTLASLLDIDLDKTVEMYASGCPKCGSIPCACQYT